jgi:hypothetical protein
MYEYVPLPGLDRLLSGETAIQPEAKVSAGAIFLRALLASIIDLPVILAGAYDEGGKIGTPQST